MKTIVTKSSEETMQLACDFATRLKPGQIVLLTGDLGAGKTTFTKGVAKGLGINPKTVTSPTFVLMQRYAGRLTLYHFDLYRLDNEAAISAMNIDEYLYGQGVCLIEWPERLGSLTPTNVTHVTIKHAGHDLREICIV